MRTDFREGRDDTDSDRECVCGKKVLYFIEKTFNIEAELAVKLNQKENTYLIRVNDREETRQILQAVKLHETDRQLAMPIPAVVVQRQCCKRAFLRGAF